MAFVSKGIESLRSEIDRYRQNLRDTEESIKKITGREGLENRSYFSSFPGNRVPSVPGNDSRAKNSLFALAGYNTGADTGIGAPPLKQRLIRGRLGGRGDGVRMVRHAADSGDEEELPHKPAIASFVIAANKETKSRQETIEQQNKDGEGKARNRRMFGLLMGTLQQFKVEEKKKEDQEMKRKAVEKKLEEKQKEEKERVKKEKQHLLTAKREQQGKLKALEQTMELVQVHEDWEVLTEQLMYFIRTDSKPHIYFLPKTHTDETSKKLEQSKKTLQDLINTKRRELDEEIKGIIEHGDRNEEDMETDTPIKLPSRKKLNNSGTAKTGGAAKGASDSELEDDTNVGVDYYASGDEKAKDHVTDHRKESIEKEKSLRRRKEKRHSSRRSANGSDAEMKSKGHESSRDQERSKRHDKTRRSHNRSGEHDRRRRDNHDRPSKSPRISKTDKRADKVDSHVEDKKIDDVKVPQEATEDVEKMDVNLDEIEIPKDPEIKRKETVDEHTNEQNGNETLESVNTDAADQSFENPAQE